MRIRYITGPVLALVLASITQASVSIKWILHDSTVYLRPGVDSVDGYEFSVGAADLLVTSLGFWDARGDGLVAAHPVGVWDTSGRLIGQGEVKSGTTSPLVGEFRWEDAVAPFILEANHTYVIGAWSEGMHGDVFYARAGTAELGGGIVALGSPVHTACGSLAYPNGAVPSDAYGYVGPNLRYEVIPEPCSAGLFLAGVGSFVLAYAKKRKSQSPADSHM